MHLFASWAVCRLLDGHESSCTPAWRHSLPHSPSSFFAILRFHYRFPRKCAPKDPRTQMAWRTYAPLPLPPHPTPSIFVCAACHDPYVHQHKRTQTQTRNTEKHELSCFSFYTNELERKKENDIIGQYCVTEDCSTARPLPLSLIPSPSTLHFTRTRATFHTSNRSREASVWPRDA